MESGNRDRDQRQDEVRQELGSVHEHFQNSMKLDRSYLSLLVCAAGRVPVRIGARCLKSPNLLVELHQERNEHENGVCLTFGAEMVVVVPTVVEEGSQDPMVISQEASDKECLRVVVAHEGNYPYSTLGL